MSDKEKDTVIRTRLYALLEKKTEDHSFIDSVEKLCEKGETLSTQVFSFFPTFTRHDYKHIIGVCEWMYSLLESLEGEISAFETLTAEEVAILLLAAYWHDSGMAVDEEQQKALLKDMDACSTKWAAYFRRHPADEVAYAKAKENLNNRVIERILRNYVREHHAERCTEQLPLETEWPEALQAHGIYRDQVIAVCNSHGQAIEALRIDNDQDEFDLRLCVVLLRLADLLDYDMSRAPKELFHFLGLDRPETEEQKKSCDEWNKNKNFGFQKSIKDRKIRYRATFTDPQTEHEVKDYLKWVQEELTACQNFLATSEFDRWRHYLLPYKIEDKSKRTGYEGGDFCITMDQDRVLKLLAGKDFYDDTGVFVRELLQNAIDAVLERRMQDKTFSEDAGHIIVHCWQDADGYNWFRIDDDGIGMNQHIIRDYFLKVGHSYYESDEYISSSRHPLRQTGDNPTSRFGIGILAVFMTDPDKTLLEVSTRRYDERDPLRMNVYGLHGYYALTRVTQERPGLPMHASPSMKHEESELGRDIGTTICVRLNRFYGSFRELMDKYIMFPDVEITYYDEHTTEGYTYLTQKKLMDLVCSLNYEDGTIKEYCIPFSDEMIDYIQAKVPNTPSNNKKRPALKLSFFTLDTLMDNNDISCVFATACSHYSGIDYSGNLGKSEDIEIAISSTHHFTLKDLSLTEDEEKALHRILGSSGTSYDLNKGVSANIAFNGVLVYCDTVWSRKQWGWITDIENHLERSFYEPLYSNILLGYVLLLRGKSRPTVNIARNRITDLPIDTICELAMVNHCCSSFYGIPQLVTLKHFAILPERTWREILERHPQWIELIGRINKKFQRLKDTAQQVEHFSFNELLFGNVVIKCLLLTLLNQRFMLEIDNQCNFLSLSRRDSPSEASELPVFLLINRVNENNKFADLKYSIPQIDYDSYTDHEYLWGIQLYSQTHRFSQWLHHNQYLLHNREPAIYNDLLETMVICRDKSFILKKINCILKRLSSIRDNPFAITEQLFLTDNDFE